MQMKTVVNFNLSSVFNLLNNNLRQALQQAFVLFNNNAECYCLDICNIRFNDRRRKYINSPLARIQGNKRGIFIIFNETQKTVFCVGSSETQDFFPNQANGGSGKSGVVRYINGNNPRIKAFRQARSWTPRTYLQYIRRHSIFFSCLKPAPNISVSLDVALSNLKTDIENILTQLGLPPQI